MDTNNYLPEEPEKRRVIMVLSRQELNQLEIDAESDNSARELLLNRQVSLLDDSAKDDSYLIKKLRNSGLLNPGTILIQSPYDPSDYAEASNASYNFAQAKCINFTNLCGLLGAKKITVEHMEMKSSDGETKISGNVDTPVGKGNGEVESKVWGEMLKKISIEEEYDPSEPNIEEARSYLMENQWLSDPHMKGLIFKREKGIRIKKHKFVLSLTEESQKNLKVAFSLNLPQNPSIPIVGKLNANLEQTKKETFDFSLEINVEFW
ncbi:hypothetical protein AFK68_23360 [Hydrocoleum sp. CS-953]|uniref:hypothetical protein n=1 Tax=Hydrocoleum sp. CS-953 TaxID=1671698 RepID=UPI000B9B8770|nr:hypothetical protein [Hydrocoleum sp. CS-953]OZH52594.1 hypothetical protein AFK68_23360 [Hydrocoleum sp. CS-953]